MTLSSTNNSKTKEIRKFGLISCIIFGFLFALSAYYNKTLTLYSFGSFFSLGVGFLIAPDFLAPVYRGVLKVFNFIGMVNTTIILTVFYCFVITPASLMIKVFGVKTMSTKFDYEADSYWVLRKEPCQPRERFLKRY